MEFFTDPETVRAGEPATLHIALETGDPAGSYKFVLQGVPVPVFEEVEGPELIVEMEEGGDIDPTAMFDAQGAYTLQAHWPTKKAGEQPHLESYPITVAAAAGGQVPQMNVALVAEGPPPSRDDVLWRLIEKITTKLRFNEFREYFEQDLCDADWYSDSGYEKLESATKKFVRMAATPESSVSKRAIPSLYPDVSKGLAKAAVARSYVSGERDDLAKPFLSSKTCEFPLPNVPFVELIREYWLEEGMLVQTLNHIIARFQNIHPVSGPDRLARFSVNPLMPARGYLWALVASEQDRLTVRRRAAEYQYEYGLQMLGRAVPRSSRMVERRTQFLEAFHTLLHDCYVFYKEHDDKTVEADAFPLLSSLRELHLVLARGAHNQFADLPVRARAEMLSIQWVLALPEMREFLGGPTMVPYDEPWMDRVDAMKSIQGWSDVSITHFYELGLYGEQLLLMARLIKWNDLSKKREDAANFALTCRNPVQRYIHAYRTVTGIDLATKVDATMPSLLLARRLQQERVRS